MKNEKNEENEGRDFLEKNFEFSENFNFTLLYIPE